jgi:recombination protein RecT
MANELVKKFETQLVELEPRWRPTLPENVDPSRFRAAVVTAVMKNPELLQADRTSLMMACMQSANSGILPDGREGAIVVFKDWKTKKKMAQWLPMTSGVVRRLRELGDLTSISAYCVYKGDTFEVMLGDDPKIIHKPDPTGSRDGDDIIAAYAIFRNGDEVIHREVMTREEIDQTRGVSRAKDGPAWKQWLGEMARKTVIRRGSKSIPLSAAAAAIIETDDQWVDFSVRDDEPVTDNPLNDNPLNDDVVDAETGEIVEAINDPEVVEDAAPEVSEEEVPAPKQDPAKMVLAKIAEIETPDRLEAFVDKYKDKIATLSEPAQGKIRSAYRRKLKELRA